MSEWALCMCWHSDWAVALWVRVEATLQQLQLQLARQLCGLAVWLWVLWLSLGQIKVLQLPAYLP